MNRFLVVSFLAIACAKAKQSIRTERNALPQEIYRENVEPAKGGKVPESAHLRAELNMIDTAGLRDPEGIEMERMMAAMSPELPEQMLQDTMSQYHPGKTPTLRLKPGYGPAGHVAAIHAPSPLSYSPVPAPAPYSPTPYTPAGPVLLKEKPYEVKTVQALPITVAETYTTFDCRGKYANRHYADTEAGCEIYHFCHEDGKQDTFHCSYGTAFNEYLGTCDHEAAVHCVSAEGYAGPAPYHAPAPTPYAPAPAPYHAPAPAPYHPPAPAPTSYAPTPAPYHSITPFVAHAPAPTPYAPAPSPAPSPFVAHAPAPYHPAPAPYSPAPTPYHPAPPAPAPYHEPLAYEQSAPPISGLVPFTQF